MLPFTREQFLAVFASYNVGVWPVQLFAYALAVGILALFLRRSPARGRGISAGLAVMWLWTGIAYHGLYFTTINSAAWAFGALFVVQGALFLHAAIVREVIDFGARSGPIAWLGWALVAYATVLYPLLGLWAGHQYPELPMFGITPCPVTLFTFGLLLLAKPPVPLRLLVLPMVWSLIGGSAAFLLGMVQDWPLLLSGVVVGLIALLDRRRSQAPPRHFANS